MAGIIRSTTPTIRFRFNVVNVPDIVKAYLTIEQENKRLVEKDIDDAVISDKEIAWTLTQEETLAMDMSRNVKIQVKYKTMEGLVSASRVYEVHPYEILKEDVI